MQQHRVYLDDWTLLEKICLVSAVQRFGENWTSICEFIKPKLQEERQWDWFTAETCEAQYKQLYNENVNSSNNGENPILQIVQNLKSRCKIEGQPLEEQKNKYLTLKKILEKIAKNEIGSEQFDKYYEKALQSKKDREESCRKYQELLKKRDISKAEYEKMDSSKSPNKGETKTDASSPVTTSPLLSSLLNNPPAIQYRPTLSTASFVQSKISQSPSNSTGRPSTSFSTDSPTSRRLSFPDIPVSPTPETSTTSAKDTRMTKETTAVVDAAPKSDSQNLESLVLISPNEEYLSEVDIPPETLLEVIDNLKEGTISLDKIIRDLEGSGEDGIIINKEDLSAVTADQSYVPVGDVKSSENVSEGSGEALNASNGGSEAKSTPSEETVLPPIRGVVDNPPTIDEPAVIDIAGDDTPKMSPVQTAEPEPSTSELCDVHTTVDDSESEVTVPERAEEDVKIDDTPPDSDKPTESTSSVNESETVDEAVNENDVCNDDSRLSADGYVTCESSSELNDTETAIVDDQEQPPSPSSHVENPDDEIPPANNELEEVGEKSAPTSTDAELPDESVNITAACEPEHDVISQELAGSVENVVEETNVSDDVVRVPDNALENQQTANAVADKVVENTKTETTSKRRHSTSLRYESRAEPDEMTRPLRTVPEETASTADEQPSTNENVVVEEAVATPRTSDKEVADVVVVDDEAKNSLPNRTARRQSRKRKSVSESNDTTPAKVTRRLTDANESLSGQEEVPSDVNKELNVTIKDLRDGIDPSLEAELLKPKEEPLDKEVTADIVESNEKIERESKNVETRRRVAHRRSSARTQSPAVKLEPMSASSPNPSDDSELARTRRKSILLAYSRLMSHKYSNAFQKPITNKQVPGYENVIYNPMDLHTIKRKIDNRQISSVTEFQRDVLLMLNNAKMFNQINSQVYNMAVEVQKDTLDHLEVTVQALGEGILRKAEKTNAEKIRKRQSLEISSKKDPKLVKRTKSASKDDAVPTKKIKLEENEDAETHP